MSRHLTPRDLHDALDRWRGRGLISGDQAEAIAAFEAAERAEAGLPEPSEDDGLAAGSVLAYAGVLVALGAVLGLYLTVLSDAGAAAEVGVSWVIVSVALGLTLGAGRVSAGAALTDALGFATTVLVAWAMFQTVDAAGWMNDSSDAEVRQMRMSLAIVGAVVAAAGWGLARRYSPMSALAAAVAAVWAAAALAWVFTGVDREGPGTAGGQVAVVAGFVLAAGASVTPALIGVQERARTWVLVGALGAANVAAFILAISDGGIFEGLLLAYALGLGVAALALRRRAVLVFAAITLYEYVGLVVFRTFEGAVAAIIVLALVGLGTAIGGTAVQRGLANRFLPRFR
ncbi:MAG: hypothetical protein AMXMBFR23_08610 [Chloroflexota bacterium]